jgi:hypothetical protein
VSRKPRIFLLLLGLLLVFCSLAALLYSFWPIEGTSVQATLVPTLLAPPP